MQLQTKTLALLIAVVAISGGLVGYAVTEVPSLLHSSASSSNTPTYNAGENFNGQGQGQWMNGPPPRQGPQFGGGWGPDPFNNHQAATDVPAGTNITIASTSGQFFVIGNHDENGTASGTLTFTVDSNLTAGYVLTLSSGTITINGTTYTITSGSAEMNPQATGIVGQGTATSGSTFLLRSTAQGNFSGNVRSRTGIDFKTGSTEYAVFLSGTIQG